MVGVCICMHIGLPYLTSRLVIILAATIWQTWGAWNTAPGHLSGVSSLVLKKHQQTSHQSSSQYLGPMLPPEKRMALALFKIQHVETN